MSLSPLTPEDRYAHLVEAFTQQPNVTYGSGGGTKKRRFGSTALKVKGKIFAMLVKDHFVVKLPKQRVDALIAAGEGALFDKGNGQLMKEWLSLNDESTIAWESLASEAMAFVALKR